MAGTLPTQAQMDAKLANVCEQVLRVEDMIGNLAQYTDAYSPEDLEALFGAESGWGQSYLNAVGDLKVLRNAITGELGDTDTKATILGCFRGVSRVAGPVL